jgi:hypothetical protein
MSFYGEVWAAAAETFGQKRGHKNPLTPYTRTWKIILQRAEHALWVWNDKYGPLNGSQREYATTLVVHSLTRAREAPDCNSTYAYFNATLTRLLNHETVDAGFKSRDEQEPAADLSAVLGMSAAELVA